MKRVIAALLVLGGIAIFVSGCNPKEKAQEEAAVEKVAEHPAAEKVAEHPAAEKVAEHPAAEKAADAPKDHPAH